jgi:isopenicillin N synthase-like dioxygenase
MPSAVKPTDSLVPTIDIASFLADPRSSAAEQVIDAVRQACRKTGFFQVVGHGIPEDLQHQLFEASRQFFALSSEEKTKLDARTTIGRRGYDVLASQAYDTDSLPDLKEGFYIGHDVPVDDPKVQARRFFMGPNVWPAPQVLSPHALREPVERYFEAIHALSLRVLSLIERTLPYGPGIFDDFTVGQTVAVLRMLHYPPAPPRDSPLPGKKQLGAGAHTDFGAITLLLQDDHPGLEVLDPETSEFVAVAPSPNAFVFNVGDMLSFWTGGEYKSSVHRVINKAPTDRYSAAFFYDGALDCPLIPLNGKGGAAEGEEGLTVEKHLIQRITESYGESQKK